MVVVPQAEDVLVERTLLTEDLIAVLAPVAAEHHTQGVVNGLGEEGVADQGDQVGVELLDVSSVPDRSGGVSQDGEQVSAAVDDLRVNSSKVCRHHHNELLPSND